MKRFRFYVQDEEKEVKESFNLAKVLMLLSRGSAGGLAVAGEVAAARVFECKTCCRQFPSFQALGGHRASHKKPRLGGDGPDRVNPEKTKPRVHECSVCGLEFAIGQALGGHMRRHRAIADVIGMDHFRWVEEKGQHPVDERGAELDLNLVPPLEAEEVRRLPKLLGIALAPGTVNSLY